ncbi:DMT family transporter [Panacibacter microcysteis]|uniref:DMT family transporter n=1 Tax=Panacibacter microcysteis TaxID=2793269 RepID=UPI001E2D54A3|nr:DMT family transporter [Panacibacter microcysteis]
MPASTKQTNNFFGFIVAFAGAVLFSTKAIMVKKAFADTGVSALSLLTFRMLFSLPFYLVTAFVLSNKQSNVKFTSKDWWLIIFLGVIGYYLSSLFDFTGLQYVSAGIERLILFLYPTFVVLINACMFGQAVTRTQKIALILTYIGIGIAYFGELNITSAGDNFFLGSLLIFLCAVTYASYLVGSGRLIPKLGASKFTAYVMLTATAGVLVHFFAASGYSTLVLTKELTIYAILLAVVATVIPSFLIAYGMKTIGANNTAIVTSVGPVSTILQAHWILGEHIFTEQIIGTILVIIGVLLIGWKQKTATAEA